LLAEIARQKGREGGGEEGNIHFQKGSKIGQEAHEPETTEKAFAKPRDARQLSKRKSFVIPIALNGANGR
jgi:hypothetical protein